MDFGWTDEQEALRRCTLEFAQRELNVDSYQRDRDSVFLRELWRKCAEFGVLGAYVPPEYGGRGYDVITAIMMMEALGYGCADNGLTLALNGQIWAVQEPILTFGSESQKRKYLAGMVGGALIGAHGMTEPSSGSDAFGLQTRADKRADGYVLNGQKSYIGLAPIADIALVFATLDPKLGHWGITAFIVELGSPGCVVGSAREKSGLRTAPLGDIQFEDCFVPAENRLGREGAGASIFNASMEWERSFIFASHVGAMARQLDRTIAYARERQQFGQPIGKFQAVSNRIADMKVRLEAARLLLYKAAWLKQHNQPASLDAAIAKLFVSESFAQSSLDAVRIHGARGYLSEFEVERDLRDATGGLIYSGTNDIQRNIIAGLLGL